MFDQIWKLLILIAVLILGVVEFRRPGDLELNPTIRVSTTPTPTGTAHLELEHTDVGPWIGFNNTFHDTTGTGTLEPFWSGFVVQLGEFSTSAYVLDAIEFLDAANNTIYLSNPFSEFLWINIVSDWSPVAHAPPIKPDEAFWLFPNGKIEDDCTKALKLLPVPGDCINGRMIHSGLEKVRSVITYWQGPGGYLAESTQPYGPGVDARWEFWFNSDFDVEVWRLDPGDPGDETDDTFEAHPNLPPIKLDQIARIIVRARKKPPGFGDQQPPPWWYP